MSIRWLVLFALIGCSDTLWPLTRVVDLCDPNPPADCPAKVVLCHAELEKNPFRAECRWYRDEVDFRPLRCTPCVRGVDVDTHPQDIPQRIRDFSPLVGLKALQELDVFRAHVDDFRSLEGARIKELSVAGSRIDDLAGVELIPRLESLHLGSSTVGNFDALGRARKLTHLDLDRTNFRDLTLVASLRRLRHLSLVGTAIADFTPLASSNVSSLWIGGVSKLDVSSIGHIEKLKYLTIETTEVVNLVSLANLALEKLELRDVKVSEAELAAFRATSSAKVIVK